MNMFILKHGIGKGKEFLGCVLIRDAVSFSLSLFFVGLVFCKNHLPRNCSKINVNLGETNDKKLISD